jgi:hypothetical protein
MTSLEVLSIGEARFTAEGLKVLKMLPKLKQLTIYESDITEADVEKVRKELTGVQVKFEPLTEEQRKKLVNYWKE